MPPTFTEPNDQVQAYKGDYEEVDLAGYSSQILTTAALNYLDAVEWSTVDNRIRAATGAAASRYIGTVMDSGGVAAGAEVTIGRGHQIQMTIVAGGAAIAQGDYVSAETATTCSLVNQVVGGYGFQENVFGEAMEAGVAGGTIWVKVRPRMYILT